MMVPANYAPPTVILARCEISTLYYLSKEQLRQRDGPCILINQDDTVAERPIRHFSVYHAEGVPFTQETSARTRSSTYITGEHTILKAVICVMVDSKTKTRRTIHMSTDDSRCASTAQNAHSDHQIHQPLLQHMRMSILRTRFNRSMELPSPPHCPAALPKTLEPKGTIKKTRV